MTMAEDPLSSVVLGAGKMLSFDFWKMQSIEENRHRAASRADRWPPDGQFNSRNGRCSCWPAPSSSTSFLISAQVSTTAGIPVIQVVTFGAFAEVQRGTMKSIDSVRRCLDRLRRAARRAGGKRGAQARAADAAGAAAGGAGRSAADRPSPPAAGTAPARRARRRWPRR